MYYEPTMEEAGMTLSPVDLMNRGALEASAVAVYTTDASGVITSFNEAAVEFWGRRPEIGADKWYGFSRLFFLDGREMSHEDCPVSVTLRDDPPTRGVEAIAERPDGSRRSFIAYASPLHNAGGEFLGAVNVLIDTAERSENGEAAAYLDAIITSSDDAIVSKDLEGTVTSWNAAAERIFGFTAKDMIGHSIRLIIPPDRQAEEDDVIGRVRRGERVEHYETWRLRKDGTQVPISLTVSPVRDRHNRIIGASKVARDISERLEADRAVGAALATKDEFLGLVSHEMRTPLTMILGNASVLARRVYADADEDAIRGALEDIHHEARRLNDIIDDMLWLARLDGRHQSDEPIGGEPLALGRVVEQVVKEYMTKSARRIALLLPPDAPIVGADEAVVLHVLGNYLSNAEKYSPLESTIEVTVEADGSTRVLDRGIGFDPVEADRLFESFYRSANVGLVSGIGIGLAVCRRLVAAAGGTVWATPREGGGSEFGFRLPLFTSDD